MENGNRICDYLESLIRKEIKPIRNKVIKTAIRTIQKDKRDSGKMLLEEDSGLNNMWDEICVQTVEGNEHLYDGYLQNIFNNVLNETCNEHQLQLLWIDTTGYNH